MGYYIRVLSKSTEHIPFAQIQNRVKEKRLNIILEIEDEDENIWTQFSAIHPDGTPICDVERNEVLNGSLAYEEINEFLDEISECMPKSAVNWLKNYLADVKTIYAFRLLSGTDKGSGWDTVNVIRDKIWRTLGGIIQADNEGFSNENGEHILWQFNDDAKGSWEMAVLDSTGKWINFKMNLGNKKQREEFYQGKVPKTSKRIKE